MKLSLKQQEIASIQEGSVLVNVGEGSGKTQVLVERIKRLATLARRKVVTLTSTNKGCEEIKKGLRDLDEKLKGHIIVTTFQSMCESIIKNHIANTRFITMPQIFTEDDRKKILEEIVEGNPSLNQWYNELNHKQRKETLYHALDNISLIKRSVILDDNIYEVIKDEQMRSLYFKYREQMDSINAIDFDDLPLYTYQLLVYNPLIADLYRRAYQYICIDEAQDLNKAQYMLLRAITGKEHRNVMLIGNKQKSIYSLNGSDTKYMEDWFVKDYAPVIYELNENYSSAKAIQEFAQTVVPENSLDANMPYNGICKEQAYQTPWEEARGVVDIIKNLIGKEIEGFEGELGYSDIAVIARNKVLLAKIEEELKVSNIPYHYSLTGNSLGFTSVAGKAFDLAIIVRSNPTDRMYFDMLQSVVGVSHCKSCEHLIENIEDVFLKDVVSKALELKEDCSNLPQTLQSIIDTLKTSDICTFKSIDEAIVAFNEFSFLKHHWDLYSQNIRRGTLSSFYNAVSLGETSANPGGKKGVTLSTVHTMRGKQAVVVFLIGMDEGIFPDYRAVEKGKESSEMQQEKDNLYSAINRAQRHLYIFYPQKREMPSGDWTLRDKSSLLPKELMPLT